MLPDGLRRILAFIAIALLSTFIIGLAHSISSGFAGFWGGLPFWVIAITVLSMAAYNYWEQSFRGK